MNVIGSLNAFLHLSLKLTLEIITYAMPFFFVAAGTIFVFLFLVSSWKLPNASSARSMKTLQLWLAKIDFLYAKNEYNMISQIFASLPQKLYMDACSTSEEKYEMTKLEFNNTGQD
jgi:hypothetical protein